MTIEQRVSNMEEYFKSNVEPPPERMRGREFPGEQTAHLPKSEDPWVTRLKDFGGPVLSLLLSLVGLVLLHGRSATFRDGLMLLAKCLACGALVAFIWDVVGYSLVFGESLRSPFLGGTEFFFLHGVNEEHKWGYKVPESLFANYHGMFALLASAILASALGPRTKLVPLLLLVYAWMLLVYCPVTHIVWAGNGLMNGQFNPEAKVPSFDMGGALVPHFLAGWSAFVLCLVLARPLRWNRLVDEPSSPLPMALGAGLLWAGAFGIILNTGRSFPHLSGYIEAAPAGGVAWVVLDSILQRRFSAGGLWPGMLCGLIAVTPILGMTGGVDAIVPGSLAGLTACLLATYLQVNPLYFRATKIFAIHGAAGAVGLIYWGALVGRDLRYTSTSDESRMRVLFDVAGDFLAYYQLAAILLTMLYSGVVTALIAYALRKYLALQPVEARG